MTMTADLPVESLHRHLGAPDVALDPMVQIGKPQPWPGTPLYACPYRIGEAVGYASGVDEAEALLTAAQTVAQIIEHGGLKKP